jgi:hypothetical protein
MQQLLQAELGLWLNPVRHAMSINEYLELVTGQIAMGGAEQAAIDALAEAKNEFHHIDEYLQMMFQTVSRLVSEQYQECTHTTLRDVILDVVGVTNPIYPDPVAFGELGTVACVPPLRACLETPAAADVRASGQERPRGATARRAALLRREQRELTGCCLRLTPGRLPQAAPGSGLAQGQVKEERRGYPLVAAGLPVPQGAEHVVDGLRCGAALDGGRFERCQCAGVDLEA